MAECRTISVVLGLDEYLAEERNVFEALRQRTAICWDLDSTLRSSLQRHHLKPVAAPEHVAGSHVYADWQEYDKAGQHDAPLPGSIVMMRMAYLAGVQNHVVSGSTEAARAQSEHWLDTYAPYYHAARFRLPSEDGIDSGELKARYVLELQAQGIEVLAFWEDWPANAKTITERTGVPCVVVNPVYPDMCTCGFAQREVKADGTGSA